MSRHAEAWLLLVLVASAAVAGCAAGGPEADSDVGTGTVVDAGGERQPDEPPAKEVVQTPAGAVAKNKGLLVGRVHDAANFSIAGARIDLLGTEAYTFTDDAGRFRLENLTPGSFDVRVEGAGFLPVEQRVRIEAGRQATLDVILPLKPGLDPGLAPHIHDYWGTRTTWTLMDHDVALPERRVTKPSTTQLRPNAPDNSWAFVLPEQEDGLPATVWPGTASIRFTLSWDTAMLSNLPNAGIHVLSPTMDERLELGYVPNGGTLTYTLTSAVEADLGHSLVSRWQFWADIDNSYGNPTTFKPTLGEGGLHVNVEIVKGDLVLEAAHRDFWNGTDVLPIGDQQRGCFPNTGVPPQESDQTTEGTWVCIIYKDPSEGAVNIVPPGTKSITVEFTWTHQQGLPLPVTYSLTYRTPLQPASTTPASEYREPRIKESGPGRVLYEVDVGAGEADGFYQERSGWGFKWHLDDNPGYMTGYGLRFGFKVTAYKDPAY